MGKVHMDKFKAAVESLKKIAAAKDEQEMFLLFSENRENFDTAQQRWFDHSRDAETVQGENEDYLQNIVRYVDIAISMYSKAITHKSLDKVILMFTKIGQMERNRTSIWSSIRHR